MPVMKKAAAILILILAIFSHAASAQTPPEARPFTAEQQGKSLSDLERQARPAESIQNPAEPAPGKIQPRFSSFDKLGGEPKSAKPADAKTPDGRQPNVEIWLPPEFQSSERKWPLLIFSHGFGGCARQSDFLTRSLADHGYIVIAPDHADADCHRQMSGSLGSRLGDMRAGKKAWPEKPFRNPEAWNEKTEADRRDDVLFALASMLDDRQYKNYVDRDHIGLIGHSLGGYTVLGLAGGWRSWTDKRFKAVLALSPYTDPFIVHRTLAGIDAPVMYQTGTRDKDITPRLKQPAGAFSMTPAPRYFIEFEGADHYAWTELERGYQSIIVKTASQFFDKYLKGEAIDIQYEAGKDQIKTFWKDEGAK